MRVFLLVSVLAAAACGGSSTPMNGPTMSSKVGDDLGATSVQSDEILGRDAVTSHAKVKHVLVAWRDLKGELDPRAQKRTKEEASQLALEVLGKLKKGEAIEPLMLQYSEDPGSKDDGRAYDVAPDEALVFEFKRLSLRLNVGEAGIVETQFGWHVIQRIE